MDMQLDITTTAQVFASFIIFIGFIILYFFFTSTI